MFVHVQDVVVMWSENLVMGSEAKVHRKGNKSIFVLAKKQDYYSIGSLVSDLDSYASHQHATHGIVV